MSSKLSEMASASVVHKQNVKEIVEKAIECDNRGHLLEALSNYGEAVQMLLDLTLNESNEVKKKYCFDRMRQYSNRSDQIKSHINRLSGNASLYEQITIPPNSMGHSYRILFGKYLNNHVREVLIEETEMYEHEQLQNLVSLIELILKNCKHVSFIKLCIPGVKDDPFIWESFLTLKVDLEKNGINFHFKCDQEIPENRVLLSNGYIIKSTYGLSFYKNSEFYSVGINDFDFRECKLNEITIWKINPLT